MDIYRYIIAHVHKTSYAPVNIMAPCIIFSNRTRLTAHAISRGPQMSRVPRPNPPRNGFAHLKKLCTGP